MENNNKKRQFDSNIKNGLHVISSRLDWDADTIFPLYGRIIDDGAIWWSGGAGSGGVVGGG